MKTVIIQSAILYYSAVTILRYVAIEFAFRSKWLFRNILAFCTGHLTYKKKIQVMLDHNQKIYADMRQYEAGFYYNGQVHPWNEAKLF